MQNLIVLPLLVPFATAIACLAAFRSARIQTCLGVGGTLGLLAASLLLVSRVRDQGILVLQLGDWPAPFGITFVADYLGSAMVLLTAIIATAVAIYSIGDMDSRRKIYGYYTLFHFMLMGLCGAFLTGDVFNLYVWFEVTLISSYVLVTLGGLKSQLEGGLKYVTINLVASALLLAGIGILYGKVGTLNMADLAYRLNLREEKFVINTSAMLFFVAFGIKSAAFPLYFWLPAAYPKPPAAVAALFAGLLTKLGAYALIRSFTLFFSQELAFNRNLILVIAGLTMVTGAMGAVAQKDLRRLLSFSIISQMGYVLMGLGISTRLALAGAVFFMFQESIAKTALFLMAGSIMKSGRSQDIGRLGGLLGQRPWLSGFFLLTGLSLAGLPPLSGFVAKFSLIKSGLLQKQYMMVAVALAVAVLTLMYIMKVWLQVFWKPAAASVHTANRESDHLLLVPACLLAAMTAIMGIYAEPFMAYAHETGRQLLDSRPYIQAVLGR